MSHHLGTSSLTDRTALKIHLFATEALLGNTP
jgi:hypothetical protein